MSVLPFEKRNFKRLIRYSTETNPDFGKKPKDRSIIELLNFGVINLDKPSGPTSHEVADTVKKLFKASACGHGGTLDPRVTGVLPIGLNKATRLLQVFLEGGKEYVCEMKLHKEIDKKSLLKAFKQFTGKIKQLPPIKSSVKRVLRQREVYYINLLEFNDRTVLFRVGCEAGTYIRKLCTDIGDYLKVKAHMQELRRTKAACFKENDSVSLFDVQDALTLFEEKSDESLLRRVVKPAETATLHLKNITASDGGTAAVAYGAPLMLPGVVELDSDIRKDDLVSITTLKGELVALGKALMTSSEMVKESKGLAVDTIKVFMEPDTYPRSWKE
ncbi:MAG: RNA-guided pseudouridylation complex pseudouridine synthase subunit Cbf5 [Nanoarchaeota archaeon]|nr:RNA-guided pseudouridylation complex pseudouridine synthase subunit Cbf5 [Nanoarchaeota archaeon]